ncbi:RNA polymerase sigma factor [Robertkochia solimangrovi]|uniref:RNA polymerase sigma factor n=1 Tax=Robertkochia solimangrovi TaxID=2213046 RepID=UPI00117D3847|nr:sigma-70 family RNA polymerase sigma factor [Robertkochia solimangrovi]TRZ41439.1 RNA polymerase subunit sigma-70 [Robertkochia solimangrovi]
MEQSHNPVHENIKKAKKGDQKAFSFLLDNFWNDVYSFQLLRTRNENDAEDITVRTFSKAFDRIDTYKEEYEFKTWLITISKNIHIDLLRKQRTRALHQASTEEADNVYDLPDDTPTAEDKLITEQNLAKLLQYIKKLKPHYQEVINLRYFQELSYEEIAKHLDESLTNVKVKLLRARKLLATIIEEKD